MKRVSLIAATGAILVKCLLMATHAAPQMVGPPAESDCNGAGTVLVTVSDPSGALIPDAFVLFRADRGGAEKRKSVPLELWTDYKGEVRATVPCGYVDFFVAADGFTPHAEKMQVERNALATSIRLKVAPMQEE